MRRINGWGDDRQNYPLSPHMLEFLNEACGPGRPPTDRTIEELTALAGESPSALPAHPLVQTAPLARLRHARGQSLPDLIAMRSGQGLVFPDGVAYPTSDQEVAALLEYAARVECRVIPYGGGTSVVGHINPLPGERPVLTVNLSRLNRLYNLDRSSRLATFGAGVSGPDLEATLRAQGFTLGHFPQSFELSTLGGWIASRSSGQQSLLYGRIERLFAGGLLMTPQGPLEIPPFPASAAATDLREMVLGSEGHLGILTRATVRISALPSQEEFLGVFFPDFERGTEATRQLVAAGLPLSMLRLSTGQETAVNLALAGPNRALTWVEKGLAARGFQANQKCLLLLGLSGSPAMVRLGRKLAFEIIRHSKGQGLGPLGRVFGNQWSKSRFRLPYLRNSLWEKGWAVDTVETATNWSNVESLLARLEGALRSALTPQGERVLVFTHLSHFYPQGSSLYTTFIFRLGDDSDETLQRWQLLKAAVSRAIVEGGGTISHQHGVGFDHAPYLAAEKGELGLAAIEALYRQFDPQGLMNPGKTLPLDTRRVSEV